MDNKQEWAVMEAEGEKTKEVICHRNMAWFWGKRLLQRKSAKLHQKKQRHSCCIPFRFGGKPVALRMSVKPVFTFR